MPRRIIRRRRPIRRRENFGQSVHSGTGLTACQNACPSNVCSDGNQWTCGSTVVCPSNLQFDNCAAAGLENFRNVRRPRRVVRREGFGNIRRPCARCAVRRYR